MLLHSLFQVNRFPNVKDIGVAVPEDIDAGGFGEPAKDALRNQALLNLGPRNFPVTEFAFLATLSGVPSATR